VRRCAGRRAYGRAPARNARGHKLCRHQFFASVTGPEKKLENVRAVLNWCKQRPSIPQWAVDGLSWGLARDQSFNQHRPFHLAWLNEYLIHWQGLPEEERTTLLNDPWLFAKDVRAIEFARGAYQPMQEAWLYMVFPDSFENISSRTNKQHIHDAFANRLQSDPSGNIDLDLFEIRKGLTDKYGEGFHFYRSPIVEQWQKVNVGQQDMEERARDQISRQDILDAIAALDRGEPHAFGPSTFYDLLEGGRRYPPKAVVGLAARRALGRALRPDEFSGGQDSWAFRLLRDRGFKIVQKPGSDSVAVGGKDNGKPSMRIPLNTILYGPPGTGKTFATVNLALEIMDPHFLKANHSDRKALKLRFDELSKASNVRFVTFHQSFSYEDFVEELQAETDEDGNIRYIVREGVFKSLCNVAAARVTQKIDATIDITGRRIWKMSLGNIHGSDAYIFDECIKNGYALLGYGEDIDFSGCKSRDEVFERFKVAGDSAEKGSYPVTAVTTFLLNIQKGDLLVVTDGNTKFRAIGEVTGEYKRLKRDDEQHKYGQCRAVKWLRVYEPSLPFDTLMSNQFSQMTLYRLRPPAIDLDKLAGLLGASTPDSIPEKATDAAVFRVGEKFNTGYEVAYTSPDIVELIKPNKNRLPIGMSVLCTLADLVQQGTITLDDIKEKRVFDKSSNTSLEPYIVNGYENILASLVERLLSRGAVRPDEKPLQHPSNPKVLIIDEINRGNVSRIFGELITLVEGSKRLGAPEALEVTLPYSKERFGIPAELYLIGTMNTADRSLTGLDIALRRRFRFIEMPPRPEDLKDIDIDGLSIATLLSVVNDRLEILLDRDHKIGHTYFLPLRDDRASCPDISPSAVSASTGILFRGLVQNSTGP
jgi:5-methylcytosine-specific restriction enzyme B